MCAKHVGHLIPNTENGAERNTGLLRYERNLRATDSLQHTLVSLQKIAARQLNRAADHSSIRREETQES